MIDFGELIDAVASPAKGLGRFDRVNEAEPKNPPGHGLTFALWVGTIGPARGSGLAATTALATLGGRIYRSMLSEPEGMIDPLVLSAASALIGVYLAGLTLGLADAELDPRGIAGVPLAGQAGYLTHESSTYRTFDLTIPVLLWDQWAEAR